MISINYKGHPAFTDKDVTYLFGQGGYIEISRGLMIAYILKGSAKLRTQDFSELDAIQEIVVSPEGFKGMAEHLRIASSHNLQKRLISFQKVFRSYLESLDKKEGNLQIPKDMGNGT